MSDAVRWLVGIGCLAGLLASIMMNLDLWWIPLSARWEFFQRLPLAMVLNLLLLLGGHLGYVLCGWTCARHWKTVGRREVFLVGAIALVGTWVVFVTHPPREKWSIGVLLVGFWMLNGLGLAWLLRKRRRIMREANAE